MTTAPTVSLALIAKDEEVEIVRIVQDYSRFFDSIDIAYDSDVESLKQVLKEVPGSDKVNIYAYDWCNDFSHKRNFLADKITTDYYFRIDSDDSITNPENIRYLVENAARTNTSVVYCYYYYGRDEYGNCDSSHYRETLIKNNGNQEWNKKIHENIIPKSKIGYGIYIDDKHKVSIEHHADEEHNKKSMMRNIKYLLEEFEEDGEDTDLRTIAYLGRSFASLEMWDKAQYFLEKHIEGSGWDEDRFLSWIYLAEVMIKVNKLDQAIACANEAMVECPHFPDSYIILHNVFIEKSDWKKAIEYGLMAMSKPKPKTFIMQNPSMYTWKLAKTMAGCYLHVGEYDKAKVLIDEAARLAPDDPFITEHIKTFHDAYYHKEYVKNLSWMIQFINERDKSKMQSLFDSIPSELGQNEVVAKLRMLHCPPKTWDFNSIVIVCGGQGVPWAAPSVLRGLGGSEEAVINVSEQLTLLGYKVTVYNDCGDLEGIYKGVEYINNFKFNPKDKFNTVIGWRGNIFGAGELDARKKIVWLHDMPNNLSLDDVDSYDHLIVLSQYHGSLLSDKVRDSGKVLYSTNGIVPKDFKNINETREQHRIIYASSYDRGLEQILRSWADIRKAVPDAELHVYYGWDTYDEYTEKGLNDGKFKQMMLPLIDQEGIVEHGRIGHKALLREYAKANVYAYPSNFTGEINCIALTKAIAMGCNVVTNDFCVLKERSQNAVPNDKFVEAVIEALDKPFGSIDYDYIEANSWEGVAKQWQSIL